LITGNLGQKFAVTYQLKLHVRLRYFPGILPPCAGSLHKCRGAQQLRAGYSQRLHPIGWKVHRRIQSCGAQLTNVQTCFEHTVPRGPRRLSFHHHEQVRSGSAIPLDRSGIPLSIGQLRAMFLHRQRVRPWFVEQLYKKHISRSQPRVCPQYPPRCYPYLRGW